MTAHPHQTHSLGQVQLATPFGTRGPGDSGGGPVELLLPRGPVGRRGSRQPSGGRAYCVSAVSVSQSRAERVLVKNKAGIKSVEIVGDSDEMVS